MMINKEVIFGLGGLLVGAVVGSLVTYKVIFDKMEEATQIEIQSVKAHYSALAKKRKTGPYAKLEDLAREYREAQINSYRDALRGLGYANEAEADADPNFDKAAWLNEQFGESVNPEWVVENPDKVNPKPETKWKSIKEELEEVDDMQSRTFEEPFVISYDEFSDENTEFDKITLRYYEGDDTLVDDREEPIDNVRQTIGPDALNRFGYKSHDKNIVYVRNERISSDFEIIRDRSDYNETVAGFEKPKTKVRKMKVGD